MAKSGSSPQRTCVGCREVKSKESLARIVCGPDGRLAVDMKSRLPGRGAYVCFDKSCIRAAVRGKTLANALKRQIDSSDLELVEARIKDGMEKRILAFLSVLMKAGKVIVGRESMRKSLGKGNLQLLVLAVDGREAQKGVGSPGVPVRVFSSRDQLGASVGRGAQPLLGIADSKGSMQLLRWIDRVKALETAGRG
ncbi:MAG: DUF448 domain-containing protein [bacterium]|nr:DUF448 domain-containing protein [bacterium]